MTQQPSSLASAIGQLSQEIEAAMEGNGYYLASQKLRDIKDLLSLQTGALDGPRVGLPQALQTVRARLGEEVTDNRYYIAAHTLDVIAYLAERDEMARRSPAPRAEVSSAPGAAPIPAAAAPQPEPAAAAPVKSFDELAREAKARVEAVSSAAGEHDAPEPRSSEPCTMHKLEGAAPEPPAEAPEPAPVSAQKEAERPHHTVEERPGLLAGFIRSVFGRGKRA